MMIKVQSGKVRVVKDKDGNPTGTEEVPESERETIVRTDNNQIPVRQIVEILGSVSARMNKIEDEMETGDKSLGEMLKGLLEAQSNILEDRKANRTGGKSVLVKEPKLPKLVKGQRFESWWKEVAKWKVELIGAWNNETVGLEEYSVRLMKEMFKECQNEDIKKYAIEYIIDNEECDTTEKIRNKLKLKFGKTEKQEDKETRTRFKGAQMVRDISEYADYLKKQRKRQIESLNSGGLAKLEMNSLDVWIVKNLMEELKDLNKVSQYEYDTLWKYCVENKFKFETCIQHVTVTLSKKEKEHGLETKFVDVNDSMYIRPEFRKGFRRNSSSNKSYRNGSFNRSGSFNM